jgi:hypothetical protein
LFFAIGFAHGDNPAGFLSVDFGIGRPHHDHHSTVEQTDHDITRLGIGEPFIRECETHSRKHFGASRKSRPRRRSVSARFSGSNVKFMRRKLRSYDNTRRQDFS